MTKKEFLEALKENNVETPEKQYGIFMSIIMDALKKGEDVTLHEIGVLKLTESKQRKGINPKTKEEILIPAKKNIKFRPAKAIKTLINS